MTHELILTSVSQGLEQDTQGFCPVAENCGIPRQLVKRLASMSHYRHLFQAESAESDLNPVVYSHLVVSLLDNSWHVLSRISDSGTDYRHQPNHLAHHIVLRDDERVPEGPAWLLAQPGFHMTQWQTPAVRFLTGRPLPTLTAPPLSTRFERIVRERHWLAPHHQSAWIETSAEASTIIRNPHQTPLPVPGAAVKASVPSSPCPSWRTITHDAGWGGILAETARTGQQVVILFQPGMNLLPLFVEALALLPPALQWRVTFSTYFTGLPEHVACQWKGIVADSPEAKSLVASPKTLVIDLTQTLAAAPIGPYVEFARQGRDQLLPESEDSASPFHEAPRSETVKKTTEEPDEMPDTEEILSPQEMLDGDSGAISESIIPPILPVAGGGG